MAAKPQRKFDDAAALIRDLAGLLELEPEELLARSVALMPQGPSAGDLVLNDMDTDQSVTVALIDACSESLEKLAALEPSQRDDGRSQTFRALTGAGNGLARDRQKSKLIRKATNAAARFVAFKHALHVRDAIEDRCRTVELATQCVGAQCVDAADAVANTDSMVLKYMLQADLRGAKAAKAHADQALQQARSLVRRYNGGAAGAAAAAAAADPSSAERRRRRTKEAGAKGADASVVGVAGSGGVSWNAVEAALSTAEDAAAAAAAAVSQIQFRIVGEIAGDTPVPVSAVDTPGKAAPGAVRFAVGAVELDHPPAARTAGRSNGDDRSRGLTPEGNGSGRGSGVGAESKDEPPADDSPGPGFAPLNLGRARPSSRQIDIDAVSPTSAARAQRGARMDACTDKPIVEDRRWRHASPTYRMVDPRFGTTPADPLGARMEKESAQRRAELWSRAGVPLVQVLSPHTSPVRRSRTERTSLVQADLEEIAAAKLAASQERLAMGRLKSPIMSRPPPSARRAQAALLRTRQRLLNTAPAGPKPGGGDESALATATGLQLAPSGAASTATSVTAARQAPSSVAFGSSARSAASAAAPELPAEEVSTLRRLMQEGGLPSPSKKAGVSQWEREAWRAAKDGTGAVAGELTSPVQPGEKLARRRARFERREHAIEQRKGAADVGELRSKKDGMARLLARVKTDIGRRAWRQVPATGEADSASHSLGSSVRSAPASRQAAGGAHELRSQQLAGAQWSDAEGQPTPAPAATKPVWQRLAGR